MHKSYDEQEPAYTCKVCERLMRYSDVAQDVGSYPNNLYCHSCADDVSVRCPVCEQRVSVLVESLGDEICEECLYNE